MNQTVKTVSVVLQGVKVEAYSPTTDTLQLRIRFNDGKQQERRVQTILKHPVDMAAQLMRDVILRAQDDHCEFDGESLFEAQVSLVNETKVKLHLLNFFRSLYSKAQQLKNMKTSTNYINTMRSVTMSELILNGR